jgi:hypothetical protein
MIPTLCGKIVQLHIRDNFRGRRVDQHWLWRPWQSTICTAGMPFLAICDGSFEEMDFPFTITGEHFDQLYMLVDGIYPPMSRFVTPLSVPIGDSEALFSLWQESKRKDIERFLLSLRWDPIYRISGTEGS